MRALPVVLSGPCPDSLCMGRAVPVHPDVRGCGGFVIQ